MRISLMTIFAASAMLLFTQCKKNDNDGSSTPETQKDYLPSSAGSTFNYKFSDSVGTRTYTSTATGRDTTLNGKSYKVFKVNDTTFRFYAKVNAEYYRFTELPLVGEYEELYLKEDAAVNVTWNKVFPPVTVPGIPIPLTATLTYKIAEKGINYTVEGKSFSDVTRVRLDVSISPFPGPIGGRDMYYAKGVGLIKDDTNISAPGFFAYSSIETLVSYNIK